MKENYFDTPRVQPVVWEETVPARPITTPTPKPTPTPSPTPAPTPVPTTASNIPLIARQNYYVSFGYSGAVQYKYCGEREFTTDDTFPTPYYYFLPTTYDCADMEPGQQSVLYMFTGMFRVNPKPTTTESQLKALNEQYGVETVGKSNDKYTIGIDMTSSQYNSYSLAKIYFDSGLFTTTEMFDIRFN
jgi:hypothetical protein